MTDLHDTAEARAKLPDFNEAKTLDEYVAVLMALPKPEGRENCDLCRKHSSPCIVHRTPDEWGKR